MGAQTRGACPLARKGKRREIRREKSLAHVGTGKVIFASRPLALSSLAVGSLSVSQNSRPAASLQVPASQEQTIQQSRVMPKAVREMAVGNPGSGSSQAESDMYMFAQRAGGAVPRFSGGMAPMAPGRLA